MREALHAIWTAIRKLVSAWCEPNGQGSSSRIHALLAVVSASGLSWYSTITGHTIQEAALTLSLTLLGAGVGAYGWNKFLANKTATTSPDSTEANP